MSGKYKRGYYVRGHFVAEGSELDLELKRQSRGDVDASKTDRKRESAALQDLGEQLLTLRAGLMQRLQLPEKLLDALQEAKNISNFEGRRRQMQFVGKLMRKLDDELVAQVRAALQEQKEGSSRETALLHHVEQWRERLLAETEHEQALSAWLTQYPQTDMQHFRALVRQARKDAQNSNKDLPGATQRHGKAYRDLFALIKQALLQESNPSEPEPPLASQGAD